MTTDNPSKAQLMTARLALVSMVGLALIGAIWYGFSLDVRRRVWSDIFNRPGGPMTLRFLLQPLTAIIAALHDGIKDARTGRSPYVWTMLTSRTERGGRFREGLIATSRTILLGLVMDSIYQAVVLKTFYPGEAVIVAILLAFVPYVLLRGPIARIARHKYENNRGVHLILLIVAVAFALSLFTVAASAQSSQQSGMLVRNIRLVDEASGRLVSATVLVVGDSVQRIAARRIRNRIRLHGSQQRAEVEPR